MHDTPFSAGADRPSNALAAALADHGVDRRTVMKLVGAGTALSLGGGGLLTLGTGVAGAQPDPTSLATAFRYYGLPSPVGDVRLPAILRPDHTVELDIELGDPTTSPPTPPAPIPFHFDPMGLHVMPGDIVRFDFATPEHTITAYHEAMGRQQRVPDDVPPFSSPVVNAGGFWLYQFESPGTYDVFCAPHELFGMVMRIVVGDPTDDAYDGTFGEVGVPEPRGPLSRADLQQFGVSLPFPTPDDVFATDAMSVEHIVAVESVTPEDVWAELPAPSV